MWLDSRHCTCITTIVRGIEHGPREVYAERYPAHYPQKVLFQDIRVPVWRIPVVVLRYRYRRKRQRRDRAHPTNRGQRWTKGIEATGLAVHSFELNTRPGFPRILKAAAARGTP